MRLLIIGSLEGHITTAGQIALSRGAHIFQVNDIETALTTLRSGRGTDMILIDVQLNIKKLAQSLLTERFFVPIVACGIATDSALAVQAIHDGAQEYLPLPPNADLIAAVIEMVAQENKAIISQDPLMKNLLKLAQQIAPSDASVLITGESGTGKEVIARFIHQKSRRAQKPFITINCAAIPENLLESELFGHEKGAFTGAVARRIGKFEEANGGTLFLDEISEMHIHLQAKLLRAIQEREIDRVGGRQPVPIDIRILATSNRDLEQEARQGHFREDLYFRLNVMSLMLPPLRARPLDIQPLCEHFIKKFADSNGVPFLPLTSEAVNVLCDYPWRGNVRELENIMHRAVLFATGDAIDVYTLQTSGIKVLTSSTRSSEAFLESSTDAMRDKSSTNHNSAVQDDLKEKRSRTLVSEDLSVIENSTANGFISRRVADMEKDLILETVAHCDGNRTQAAHLLGISIRTLRNKLNQYTAENKQSAFQAAG